MSAAPAAYDGGKVPAVTGVTRIGESADSIILCWDEVSGVQGYRIYRRDMTREDADYTLFSTVQHAGLDICGLKPGAVYGFRIEAYIRDGRDTVTGDAAEAYFATVPDGVAGFMLHDAAKDSTTVMWEKNERADGYLLQRCFNGAWSDYQTFDADTTTFTDTGLTAGRAYYYRICAYREDSAGILKSTTSDVYTVAGLLAPADNGSASKLGRVSLDYKKSAYAQGYEIYYSSDMEAWEQLTDAAGTHYSTSRLENGRRYCFRIYPYKDVDKRRIYGTYTELEFVANKEIYGKEVGDTYVEVSLTDQHMWYIVDGDVYLESDCVTGNYGSADTPKGFWSVNNKISPCTLKGDDYVSYVTYWMPFIGGGWGLHDATWRSKFGGSIYKGDGSHGCVNLPYDIAKKLYAHITVGTPVIVY